MKIANRRFLALLLCLVLLAGCQPDQEVNALPPHTLLVYLGCDNNLSDEVAARMDALAQGFRGQQGNLLVYQDAVGAGGVPQLWQLHANGQRELVATYPEENSASGEVLRRVLGSVVSMYPSKSYGLLMFSHGSGWLPTGMLARPKSVVLDGSREMEIAELAAALPDGLLSYIAFEACYMSSVEVAYELRKKATYIVASSAEIVAPGFTPIYPSSLKHLFGGPAGLCSFAKSYFDYWNGQQGFYQSATVSVVRTAHLDSLACYTAQSLQQGVSPQGVVGVQRFDRSASSGLVFDLESYVQRAASNTRSYTNFKRMLDSSVVYRQSTRHFLYGYGGFSISNHCGLTVYVPQAAYPQLNGWHASTSWSRALQLYGGTTAARTEERELYTE